MAEPGSQLFHEAAQLEADVFSDWFDNSAADLETIYKPHQERMDLIAIVAPVGKVAGASRHVVETSETKPDILGNVGATIQHGSELAGETRVAMTSSSTC